MYRDMLRTNQEIYEEAGVALMYEPNRQVLGFASHEVGVVRMGKNPKTSVLNEFNQAREVENLFVVDGGCFTTFPEKNPTLTIVALALRAADNILALRKRHEA
jgi:choline dehydrogenase-like flavoprotein